jgi:hypothetical protein
VFPEFGQPTRRGWIGSELIVVRACHRHGRDRVRPLAQDETDGVGI